MSIVKVTYTAPTATGLTASVTRNLNSFPIPPITLNTTTNYSQTYSATFTITSSAPTTVALSASALNGYTFNRVGDTYTLTGKNNWAYFKRILRTLSIVTDNTLWPNPPLTIDTTITDGVTNLTGTISSSSLVGATPSTPVLSLLRTGGGENTLTWAASTQNPGPGVAGYYVYRDGDVVTPYATVTGVSYVDTAAGTGVRTYQIKAFDSSSVVVFSALSNTVTGIVATLTTPTLSTATRSAKASATLIWTASTASWGTWVNTYDVYRDGVFLATATGLTYTDTTAGITSRSYYVVASNIAVSSNSNSLSCVASTLSAPVLDAIPKIAANSATLTWSASTASWGTWANTYSIFRDGIFIGTSASLTYTDTNTGFGSRSYYITANDFTTPAITSTNSNTRTLVASTLSAPVLAAVSRTGLNTQQLSWSASTSNWGTTISSYRIYRDGSLLTTVTALTYTDTTAGTNARSYYIVAIDISGVVSVNSNTQNGIASALNTPTGFALNDLRGRNSVTLNWTFAGSNYGLTSPGTYEVYQDGVLVSTVTALTATITGLDPLVSYAFTIRAKDGTLFSSATSPLVIPVCTIISGDTLWQDRTFFRDGINLGFIRPDLTLSDGYVIVNYIPSDINFKLYRNSVLIKTTPGVLGASTSGGRFVDSNYGTTDLDMVDPFTSYSYQIQVVDGTLSTTLSTALASTPVTKQYTIGASLGVRTTTDLSTFNLVDIAGPVGTPIIGKRQFFSFKKNSFNADKITYGTGDLLGISATLYDGGSKSLPSTSINWMTSVGNRMIAIPNGGTGANDIYYYSSTTATDVLPQPSGYYDLPIIQGNFGLNTVVEVQYLNNLWIAASGAEYATSSDGITWTTRSLPGGKNVISGFNGLFIAADTSTTTTYTSTDGINWTLRTANLPAINAQISYNGTQWVAISRNASGNAAYSSDGITWTAATLPSSAVYGKAVYGNSTWVVINEGATASTAAAYSSDGLTWTAATIPSGLYNNAKPGRPALIFGGGKFAACGAPTGLSTMFVIHSTDGITWTQVTVPGDASNFEPIVYG